MKIRLVGVLAAVLGCATIAMASDPIDPTELPEELTAETFPGGEQQPFWCGTVCGQYYIRVKKCWTPQTCCGYLYCSTGVSQSTCCNPGTTCSWDGNGPPGSIHCIAYP